MSASGPADWVRGWSRLVTAAVLAAAATPLVAADAPLTVKRLFPAGGAAGTTVVVKAEGTFPRWPVQVWTDRPGTTWKPLEEKATFEVVIAAEGGLGVHRVRIYDDTAAADLRRFVVGSEAEAVEAEPNDRPAEAQRLSTLPATVNGVLEKAGDVDCFAVALEAEQTLVASLDAHGGIGSPVDAVLELVGETGGYLARNLDARGLDPRVVYTARRAGTVVVRVYGFPAVPNQTIALAGSSDYVYRLTLSTGPVVAAGFPAAVAADSTTTVAPLGWNSPPDRPAREVTPIAGATSVVLGFDGMAGTVELPVVPATVVKAVAAADVASAAAVIPPVVVSGWFDEPGREAAALITAKKDASLLVTIEARADGSEAELLLDIRAAAGAVVLTKTDRDSPFAWKPPADGDYTFLVRDRRGTAGPGHFFRVSVVPDRPEVQATTDADAVVGKVGGTVDVGIAVERLRGWKKPVEFVLVDPPATVSAAPVTSAVDGDTAKQIRLAIAATGPYVGPVTIAARTSAAEAAAAETVATVLAGKERLPVIWLTVPPPAGEPKEP
jgi:hypothetical protein